MEEDNKGRGDDFNLDGDKAGETADLEATKKEPEQKEPEQKEPEKKEEPRIPKSRLDEVGGQRDKARAELATAQKKLEELEEQIKASQGELDLKKVSAEIDELEEELEKAIADGNAEAKKRLRTEIRDKNQQIAEARAAGHAARATATAIERFNYDRIVDKMEVEHPELDPKHEGYNQETVDGILELKDAFEKAGHGSATALDKALKVTFKGAPAPKKAEEKKEEPSEEAKKKAEEAAAKRKEEAVKRGLDKKNEQPAVTKGGDSDKNGKTNTAADAAKMSEKEFDKLDEEELKRLRGDNI